MMILRILPFLFLIASPLFMCRAFAQNNNQPSQAGSDTLVSNPIVFTPDAAFDYLIHMIGLDDFWKPGKDTLQLSLKRLAGNYAEPYDSVRSRILHFPFDAVELNPSYVQHHDTLPVRWLNSSLFMVDTVPLEKDPYITHKTILIKSLDTLTFPFIKRIPEMQALVDSALLIRDTITEMVIDRAFLASKKIQLHQTTEEGFSPPLLPQGSLKSVRFHNDSTKIIITESRRAILAGKDSPFYMVPGKQSLDSLQLAIETLIRYTDNRDSILLFIHDIDGKKAPFWLSNRDDDLYRFWVKNAEQDSVTIWLGNPSKYALALILEEDLQVERMEKRMADDIPISTILPQRSLVKMQPFEEIPVYWDFSVASSFSMNQNYLSNWSKGGESSLSGMLDVNAAARYTDKKSKVQWTNSGRLRYGTTRTKERGFRTSADIVEANSQFNKKLRDKFDFSSVFYLKTQVAEGFNYPNDSVVISRFLNPGSFTVGAGIEYEPFKKTLINFSLLSYRNTFVLDTANINQTNHGIEATKRSRQEMGGQLLIRNSVSILNGLNINNSIRLFSNYLDKPQNVDVDWEMRLEKQISWYFTIRLNLHLIYDDDIRFPVTDADGQPVLMPDGSQKKVAKAQFNQFLGLTLAFRL